MVVWSFKDDLKKLDNSVYALKFKVVRLKKTRGRFHKVLVIMDVLTLLKQFRQQELLQRRGQFWQQQQVAEARGVLGFGDDSCWLSRAPAPGKSQPIRPAAYTALA